MSYNKIQSKKCGISILEVLIAMSVISILMLTILSISTRCYSLFSECIRNNEENYNVYEAYAFIDNKLNKSNNTVIYENKITINITQNYINEESLVNKNTIEFNAGSKELIIKYFQDDEYKSTNVILRNVNGFNIVQKNLVVYITIITNDGRKYERCLGIKIKAS